MGFATYSQVNSSWFRATNIRLLSESRSYEKSYLLKNCEKEIITNFDILLITAIIVDEVNRLELCGERSFV